jgi:hypothetical protein
MGQSYFGQKVNFVILYEHSKNLYESQSHYANWFRSFLHLDARLAEILSGLAEP